jgi:competence protein ComEA
MHKFITSLMLAFASAAAFAAVDINKADQAGLEAVKGIGPGLSAKLLDERKKGSFKDWGDLIERVGGVGPGSAAKLSAAGLTVGDKPYSAAATKPAAKAPGTTTDRGADKSPKAQPSTRSTSAKPVASPAAAGVGPAMR